MKSSQKDIEWLEGYLKGTLDEDSVRNLKARLAVEKALAEDLKELHILTQGLRVYALDEKLGMLKGHEQEVNKKDGSDHKTKPSWWTWLVVLVMALLVSYLGYHYFVNDEKKIPEEYKNIYADRFDGELILHKTMRAVLQTDSLTREQRRAYELYSIQLFDEAIPLLDALWANQKDTLALFYLGVSRIGIGQIEEGAAILQRSELKKYSEQTNIFIHH